MADGKSTWFGGVGSVDYSRKVLLWAVGAVALPVVGAAAWWIAENSFNRVTPYEVWHSLVSIYSLQHRGLLL
jgi:hypothetical protein